MLPKCSPQPAGKLSTVRHIRDTGLFLRDPCAVSHEALHRARDQAGDQKVRSHSEEGHSLSRLWISLLSGFPEQRGCEDRRVITNMGAFVNSIADIDDNGFSLRYPCDKSGMLTQDRPLFVDVEQVDSYLEKFVEQLELIDFDLIRKD